MLADWASYAHSKGFFSLFAAHWESANGFYQSKNGVAKDVILHCLRDDLDLWSNNLFACFIVNNAQTCTRNKRFRGAITKGCKVYKIVHSCMHDHFISFSVRYTTKWNICTYTLSQMPLRGSFGCTMAFPNCIEKHQCLNVHYPLKLSEDYCKSPPSGKRHFSNTTRLLK